MKIFNISIWLAVVALVMSLVSCEPFSSVEYNIHNITSDTVSVTFYREIMSSSYRGYDIEENDSVTTHHGEDSVTVALLAPNQHLKIHREWDGLYREELVVHAWKYISSIKIGETVIDSTLWDNEAAWHHRTTGGGNFSKEESHYYDLWLKDM